MISVLAAELHEAQKGAIIGRLCPPGDKELADSDTVWQFYHPRGPTQF